jgi:hypothetical protein
MTKQLSASLALALAFLALGEARPLAQGPFYALIVNGSNSLDVDYNAGFLTVRFRRTLHAAGPSTSYTRTVPPGAAAWPDRPLNDREPLMLRQRMSSEQAEIVIQRLRQNGGYWKFFCRNTGAGYFEVSRSEAAYASVRFD